MIYYIHFNIAKACIHENTSQHLLGIVNRLPYVRELKIVHKILLLLLLATVSERLFYHRNQKHYHVFCPTLYGLPILAIDPC